MNTAFSHDHKNQDDFDAFWGGKAATGAYRLPIMWLEWMIILLHGVKDGLCTCGNINCKSPGKHPMFSGWKNQGSSDSKTVEGWRGQYPYANFGIITGSPSNILVLDIDPRNGGDDTLEKLGLTPEDLAGGLIVNTGGGGRHVIFTNPGNEIVPRVKGIGEGLDIKGEDGYIVGPGSNHISGGKYEWADPEGIFLKVPGEVPHKILDLMHKAKKSKVSAPLITDFIDGDRSDALIRVAGKMRHDGHPVESICAALEKLNSIHCKPPLEIDEVLGIAESGGRYEPDFNLNGQRIKPVPLPDLPEVMDLDPEILPEGIRSYLVDAAERMGTSLAFLAIPALVILGALLGRQIGIRPKAKDDWIVFANDYGFIVAPPGSKKSAAIDASVKLLLPLEMKARAAYKAELPEYNSRLIAYQGRKKRLQKLSSDPKTSPQVLDRAFAENPLDEPEKPVLTRYYTNDTTVEALTLILKGNPNGALVISDELSKFLAMLEATHQNGARSFYNTAWEARLPYQSDRIGRGNDVLDAVCVSIVGSIQPAPLSELIGKAFRNPELNDGFLHRFQLAVYPDHPTSSEGVDREPDRAAADKAQKLFTELAKVEALGMSFPEVKDGIPFLRFTPEAQVIFKAWLRSNSNRAKQYGDRSPMCAHLHKYPKLFPGLCLIIHMLDDRGPAVGVQTAEMANRWVEFLESHARRIYAPALTEGMLGAKHLLAKIKEGRLGERFSLRDAYRKKWSHLTEKKKAVPSLNILVEYGYIFEDTAEGDNSGGPWYQVNPLIKDV